MIIKLLIDGGDMKPGPAIAQKLGPLGINIGKVIQEINQASKEFKGVKVPVELNINKDKTFSVKVLSPPTTELLKKELKIEKGSGVAKKLKIANASIEQIISVAKTKHPNMLSRSFKSAVKTVVGSCVSSGILIENKEPKEIEKEIEQGKYDKEIQEIKIETSPEKRKELDKYFAEVIAQQESMIKKEEEAKAAEEALKAAAPAAGAAAGAAGAAAGAEEKKAAPAAGAAEEKKEAKPAAGKAAAGGKKEAAKKK